MSLRKIHDMLSTGDLLLHKVTLSGELSALTYRSRKGRIHIMVDDTLSPEAERDSVLHECAHIILHSEKETCLIGMDRHHAREKEADLFAREHRAEYSKG